MEDPVSVLFDMTVNCLAHISKRFTSYSFSERPLPWLWHNQHSREICKCSNIIYTSKERKGQGKKIKAIKLYQTRALIKKKLNNQSLLLKLID